MEALTLTTDFGHRDWYVAAVKGVVLSRVPAATLVDLCHEVPPGDVETAAFFLEAAAPTFPPDTVHLAVVDPGVGTERRILAVETTSNGKDAVFVAPDNGVLDPFLDDARRVVAADRPDLHRPATGATFHGRDRFAPLAAALLGGETAADLGDEIDDPLRLDLPAPRRGDSGGDTVLHGRVRHVDRFGNLVTDLPADWLPADEAPVDVRVAGHLADLRVRTYAEIPPGRAAVLVGSLGTLELSLDGASLAEAWGVERGAAVEARLEGG